MTTIPNTAAGDVVLSSGKALVASAVRTYVPIMVTLVANVLGQIQLDVPRELLAQFINAAVSSLIGILFYVGVRLLETVKSSKWGTLLGYAKAAPVYLAPAAVANAAQSAPAAEPGKEDEPGRHAAQE